MANTTIQVRTDAEVKSAADTIFNNLGITISDGINIFLRQVNIHGGFPFDVKLPESLINAQNQKHRREYILGLCGKYKDSVFSTKRYLEQKNQEKELGK